MQWSLQNLVTCHAAWYACWNLFPPWVYSKHMGCNARPYLYSINESLSKLHELKHRQKRYKSSISRYLKGRVELNAPKNQCLSDNNIILEFLCTCIDEQSTHETLHIPFLNIDNVDFVPSVSVRYLYYLSLNTS